MKPALGAALLFLAPAASACTVCFGAPSSGLNRGFFWAIVLLLVLPFALMGTLVGLVVYHVRRHPRPASTLP